MRSRLLKVNFTPARGVGIAAALLLLFGWASARSEGQPAGQTPARAATAPADGAQLPAAELLSHAGADRYWIAQVLPRTPVATGGGGAVGGVARPPEPIRSAVRSRQSGRDWQRVIVVQGRIVDLGHRGDNAAILMEDGTWLLAWPSGSSTGPALPDGASMLALGADDLSLWAIGVTPPPEDAPDVESVVPAAPAGGAKPAAPTARPSFDDRRPVAGARLFVFAESSWQPRAALPAEIPPDAPTSLAVVGGKPMVAALVGPRRVAVARVGTDDNWAPTETIDVGFDVRQFELFDQTPNPTLWIAGPTGAGELRLRSGGRWGNAVPIQAPEVVGKGGAVVARSAEYFAASVRLTWWDGAQLRERAFDLSGQPAGEVTVLGRVPPATPQPIGSGTLVLLGVLGALLALNIFRADDDEGLELAGRAVQLAPLPRRLVAGAIDLLPIPAVALWRLLPAITTGAGGDGGGGGADSIDLAEAMQSQSFALWMTAAAGIYLLHTTLLELWTGRTVGKMACGLRTVALDGGDRPRAGAILLRNAFRVVDLIPALPLALLILFSPLRQRLGDVVAGTIVIADRPPRRPEAIETVTNEQQDQGP